MRRKSSLRNTHRKEGLSVGIRHHQENGGKKKCRGRLQIKKAPESRTPRGRGQRRQEGAVSRGEESMSNALGMLSELKERNISFQEERETYRRGLTERGDIGRQRAPSSESADSLSCAAGTNMAL